MHYYLANRIDFCKRIVQYDDRARKKKNGKRIGVGVRKRTSLSETYMWPPSGCSMPCTGFPFTTKPIPMPVPTVI